MVTTRTTRNPLKRENLKSNSDRQHKAMCDSLSNLNNYTMNPGSKEEDDE